MRFCDKCGSLINLVNKKDDTNPDKEVLALICNNCNHQIHENLDNTCVYKQVYDEDFNSDKFINNPYTKYDNTLPRVSNIKCVNENCISNRKGTYVSITDVTETSVIDDSKIEDEKFLKIPPSYIFSGIYDESDTTTYSFEESDKPYRAIVKIDGTPEEIQNVVDYVNSNPFKDNLEMNVIQNEIIYIKTDNNNLRYMYICKNCSSSWNNK